MAAPTLERVETFYRDAQVSRHQDIETALYNGIVTQWHPDCVSLTLEMDLQKRSKPPIQRSRLDEITTDYRREGWNVTFKRIHTASTRFVRATITRLS